MTKDIISDADRRMNKSLEALKQVMVKIRTGRAHPSLLEQIIVNYYGSDVPLNQAANVNVVDARTLGITAWDKKMIPDIEKAILNSDLGLNPVTAGDVIRVPLPALTEERRKELIRVVRAEAEHAKVAVRNIRRDANHSFKNMIKEKSITEDDERKAEESVQKLTDDYITQIDNILTEKEKDMMEI
jgi:ribosome recycling factor